MRCDCTAEPPGELIASATAEALRSENARSSERATDEMVSPGRSGVEKPITPDMRTTGTTAAPPRSRAGSSDWTRSPSLCKVSRMGKDIGPNRFRLKRYRKAEDGGQTTEDGTTTGRGYPSSVFRRLSSVVCRLSSVVRPLSSD